MDYPYGKLGWAIVCLLLLFIVDGTTSLKNLKITAPERVRVGDSALLTCSYDLDDKLYTIKWYLNDEEFYRYTPKKDPPHHTFRVRDIEVNVSSSNAQDVTLVSMQRSHTGQYKCEVSEDQPLYDTKIEDAYILVVDVPAAAPRIAVDRQHLPAGETLRANCTSDASRPAPNITWTLNGAPLNNSSMQYKIRTTTMRSRDGDKNFTTSKLNLDTTGLFQDGRIRLRCFAEITPVYKADGSIEITEEGPYLASITGDASPHSRQSSSGCGRTGSPQFQPSLAYSLVLGLLLAAISTR